MYGQLRILAVDQNKIEVLPVHLRVRAMNKEKLVCYFCALIMAFCEISTAFWILNYLVDGLLCCLKFKFPQFVSFISARMDL